MNKKEFMDLKDLLQQFEEEHSLECLNRRETDSLILMISIVNDYIVNYDEEHE